MPCGGKRNPPFTPEQDRTLLLLYFEGKDDKQIKAAAYLNRSVTAVRMRIQWHLNGEGKGPSVVYSRLLVEYNEGLMREGKFGGLDGVEEE